MPLFVIDPISADDDTPPPEPHGAKPMGHAAGVIWYRAGTVPAEGREPTAAEMSAALLELPAIRQLKASVRRKIEAEAGDVYELLADQSRQIEALTALTCRLAADLLGGTPMSDTTKQLYLTRVERVVQALDSGGLALRGNAEGADDMLAKVMQRTSRINQIVAENYLPRREELLS